MTAGVVLIWFNNEDAFDVFVEAVPGSMCSKSPFTVWKLVNKKTRENLCYKYNSVANQKLHTILHLLLFIQSDLQFGNTIRLV